jgi:undecaprenyl-diphosphatase
MEIWQAIVLGAVQGFAEFLPVSSSGHLLLLQRWMGITEGGLFFDVMLHIGTLIPVFIIFFKDILELFKKPFSKMLWLIIATIPAALTGMLLGDIVEGAFYTGNLLSAILLSITFIITAVELFFAEKLAKKGYNNQPLSLTNAFFMGLGQSIAIVPGLFRSGTVICSGTFAKVNNEENASFAFLMSIPIILGAAVVSGYKAIKGGVVIDALPLVFGVLTAAVTGYIAIEFMLKLIKKANYKWFSLYLVIMAIASTVSMVAFGV